MIGNVQAVDDVSLQIRRGETLGLVGESGCGKTTLGRTILRLLPADGRARSMFDGQDIFDLDADELKRMRQRMQIIFQDPVASLNPRMPVSDIIGEGLLAQADKENDWGDASSPRQAGRRLPRGGRAAARLHAALPARVLGRPAPAHRHRACARARPRIHRLRRAVSARSTCRSSRRS